MVSSATIGKTVAASPAGPGGATAPLMGVLTVKRKLSPIIPATLP